MSDETGMSRFVAPNRDGRMACTDFEATRAFFYHDCDEADARWAFERLTPAPTEFLLETVHVPRFWAAEIPRAYIWCRDDRAKPRVASRATADRLGVEPLFIEGSHSPFLARPRELAAVLVRATTTTPVGLLQPR